MTENEKLIREELSKVYNQLLINVQKVCGDNKEWRDDLVPVVIEMFLKLKIEKQLHIVQSGKLENYLTRTMKLQLIWKSDFNRIYRAKEKSRQFYPNVIYPDTISDEFLTYGEGPSAEDLVIECMRGIIDQYDPFIKEVANKIYLGNETLRTLSRRYKINYYHIKTALKVIEQDLRIHCEHCWKEQ